VGTHSTPRTTTYQETLPQSPATLTTHHSPFITHHLHAQRDSETSDLRPQTSDLTPHTSHLTPQTAACSPAIRSHSASYSPPRTFSRTTLTTHRSSPISHFALAIPITWINSFRIDPDIASLPLIHIPRFTVHYSQSAIVDCCGRIGRNNKDPVRIRTNQHNSTKNCKFHNHPTSSISRHFAPLHPSISKLIFDSQRLIRHLHRLRSHASDLRLALRAGSIAVWQGNCDG